jgi:hypothetical protein
MKAKITFVIVGLVTAIVLTGVESARADTWTRRADMPTARWVLSTSVVNGRIYAIGGVGGSKKGSSTELVGKKSGIFLFYSFALSKAPTYVTVPSPVGTCHASRSLLARHMTEPPLGTAQFRIRNPHSFPLPQS